MSDILYENRYISLQKEEAPIPWLKLFTQHPYKELSECDDTTRDTLFKAVLIIEKEMLAYYAPEKINIALFGNYLPHVHVHIMARFKEDSHFPEPMWGNKQRDATLCLPDFEPFVRRVVKKLSETL